MSDIKCVHGIKIHRHCQTCEKEMMTDFVVHNLEEFTTEEAVQCIREGIITMAELEDRAKRRYG